MQHASHKSRLPEIERTSAHLKDIAQMIEDERYCLDIITELKGIRHELKHLQSNVLQDHIDHCLEQAAGIDDLSEKRRVTAEVMKLLEATAS
jgi:DNA-binding FrmR family transcriptional regulator